MGLFNWLRGDTVRTADDHAIGTGYSFFFGSTSSGRPVTERSAMQMTAVYSCVRILAEAIAGLPLHAYQQSSDGAKVKALDHPLYRLLHDEPNPKEAARPGGLLAHRDRPCPAETGVVY